RIREYFPRGFTPRDHARLEDIAGERQEPPSDDDVLYLQALAAALQRENNSYLRTLCFHPRRFKILSAYEHSELDVTRTALDYTKDAQGSLKTFRQSISSPDEPLNVWRYPLLVFGGVSLRGGLDVQGFAHFAASIGPAYARGRFERNLTEFQLVLVALGLAFGAIELLG